MFIKDLMVILEIVKAVVFVVLYRINVLESNTPVRFNAQLRSLYLAVRFRPDVFDS